MAIIQTLRRQATPTSIILVLVGLLGLAFDIRMVVQNSFRLGIDYNQFYAGSRLAGTGHLYDWNVLRKIVAENGPEMPTARLPIVLYGHKILGGLPYRTALAAWMAGSIAALLVFAVIWPGIRRFLAVIALATSMSVGVVLLFGQDVAFYLMFFAAGLALMERKRPWLAGLAFALCVSKFHLALGIPILLVAQKRWKTLFSGGIAVALLLAASFLLEGRGWPRQYLNMVGMPEFTHGSERMPNLAGITCWLPWPALAEALCAIGVVGLLWWICRRRADLGMAGAAAAACGVLTGHHSYGGDCTLMIPLAVLTLQRQDLPPWMKVWAMTIISPLPMQLLVTDAPWTGQLLIVGFVVAAIYSAGLHPPANPAVSPGPASSPLPDPAAG